jgi:hypothetical protein
MYITIREIDESTVQSVKKYGSSLLEIFCWLSSPAMLSGAIAKSKHFGAYRNQKQTGEHQV